MCCWKLIPDALGHIAPAIRGVHGGSGWMLQESLNHRFHPSPQAMSPTCATCASGCWPFIRLSPISRRGSTNVDGHGWLDLLLTFLPLAKSAYGTYYIAPDARKRIRSATNLSVSSLSFLAQPYVGKVSMDQGTMSLIVSHLAQCLEPWLYLHS